MKTFTLSAVLESFRSLKDRSYKVVFETGELTPEQLASIGSGLNMPGYLAFNPDPFKKEMIDTLELMKVDYDDTGKSKGQRLRAVLYRMWEQNNERYEIFDDFYNSKMEKIISHYKNKLD
jgi:hypothetical protein